MKYWLACLLLVAGLVGGRTAVPLPIQEGHGPGGDTALFRAVAVRLTQGQPYYPAMRAELIARHYPTAHVANWRTPLYLEAWAHAPRALLALTVFVALALIVGTWVQLRDQPGLVRVFATLFQIGIVLSLYARQGLAEPLAGGLIALSVLASLRGWQKAEIGTGLAALFVRELAGLYVVLRLAAAIQARAWRQAAGWALGLGAYALYFGWHVWQVRQVMPVNPQVGASWVQGSGLPFLFSLLRVNGWLTLSWWWVPPIALSLIVLGALHAPAVVRWTVLGYLIAFAIVGHPFNWYWGWIPGMIFPLAVADAALPFQRTYHQYRMQLVPSMRFIKPRNSADLDAPSCAGPSQRN